MIWLLAAILVPAGSVLASVESNKAQSRATAVEIVKKLIRWHTARRWKIPFRTDLARVQVQLGDSFTLDPGWLTNQPASLTAATYRVSKKRIRPKTDTNDFEAVQVFE